MNNKVSPVSQAPAVTPVKPTQSKGSVTSQAVAAGVKISAASSAKPAPPSGGKGATVTLYA